MHQETYRHTEISQYQSSHNIVITHTTLASIPISYITHMHTHTCIHTHTHMHVHTHTHTHTQAHTHTCASQQRWFSKRWVFRFFLKLLFTCTKRRPSDLWYRVDSLLCTTMCWSSSRLSTNRRSGSCASMSTIISRKRSQYWTLFRGKSPDVLATRCYFRHEHLEISSLSSKTNSMCSPEAYSFTYS